MLGRVTGSGTSILCEFAVHPQYSAPFLYCRGDINIMGELIALFNNAREVPVGSKANMSSYKKSSHHDGSRNVFLWLSQSPFFIAFLILFFLFFHTFFILSVSMLLSPPHLHFYFLSLPKAACLEKELWNCYDLENQARKCLKSFFSPTEVSDLSLAHSDHSCWAIMRALTSRSPC